MNTNANYAYWLRIRTRGQVRQALIELHRTEYFLGGVHMKTTWQGGGREFTKADMKRLIAERSVIEIKYDNTDTV